MTSALFLFALVLGSLVTHADTPASSEEGERIERIALTAEIDVKKWTLLRERWAFERLTGRNQTALPGGAWDRVTMAERRELAIREAVEEEVDREVASLRYFRTRAPRPFSAIDGWAVTYLVELFADKARSPGYDIDREFDRVRNAFTQLSGHVITMKSSGGTFRSNLRESRALDEVIEFQGEVFGRLLIRAVEYHDADSREEASLNVAAALHVLARAYLLMGANSGSFHHPKGLLDWRSLAKNIGNGTEEFADRFATLENLRDLFWQTVTPYYLAAEPGRFKDVAPIEGSTSTRDISVTITHFLMTLSAESEGVQCDRLLGSLEKQIVATAESMRHESSRPK